MDTIFDDYGYPAHLDTGVRCGDHSGIRVYHNSAEAVRVCYRMRADDMAQQAGEIAAEAAVERYFEDRGYMEARAQEDYEAACGVIPFDVAMADALGN